MPGIEEDEVTVFLAMTLIKHKLMVVKLFTLNNSVIVLKYGILMKKMRIDYCFYVYFAFSIKIITCFSLRVQCQFYNFILSGC